jgi:hypothetical protein
MNANKVVCTRCRVAKERSDFYGDQWSANGLKSKCKPCLKDVSRSRYAAVSREPFINPELLGPRPRCFTAQQWANWVAAERNSVIPYPSNGYCTSCTRVYQTIMKARNSCAHPDTTFVLVDSEVEGVRS